MSGRFHERTRWRQSWDIYVFYTNLKIERNTYHTRLKTQLQQSLRPIPVPHGQLPQSDANCLWPFYEPQEVHETFV